MLWSGSTLGGDYPEFQVRSALSLRAYELLGIEPMWYPHLSGGFPIGGLILAQYFHLPAWLQSHLPGYWSGSALLWMTARHLLLLAAMHAAFYRACRRLLGTSRGVSYLLSFLFTYNARTLDAFRYGPALDATAYGQIAMLLVVMHLAQPRRVWLVLLAGTTQLLLTSGYPPVIPFLLLAALVVVPLVIDARAIGLATATRRLAEAACATFVGLLLAAPAVAATIDFLLVNQVRVARPTIEWATSYSGRPVDLLLSIAAPWLADVHTSFGGSTLLTMLLGATLLWAAADLRRRFLVILVLVLPFLYALGQRTPIFPFFFHHVPGFASLRVPGRILCVLPLLVFAVLMWVRSRASSEDWTADRDVRSGVRRSALVHLAGGSVVLVLVLAGDGLRSLAGHFSPLHLAAFWTRPWEAVWVLLGIGTAASLLFAIPRAGTIFAATAVLQTGLAMAHGTWWQAGTEPTPSREAFMAANQLPLYAEAPFWASSELTEQAAGSATIAYTGFMKAAATHARCYLPVEKGARTTGLALPFYLSRRIVCAADRERALQRLGPEGDCDETEVPKTIVSSADCVPADASSSELARLNGQNRLLVLQPNRVRFAVGPEQDAVFVTPFPDATSYWSATIDGRAVPFILVNGGFLGLPVPAGDHVLEMTYFSRPMFWGLRIFLLTSGLLSAALAVAGARRIWPGGAVPAIVIGGATVILAVAGARLVEQRFVARAGAPVLLSNRYPELLRRQISNWTDRLPQRP